MIYGNTGDHFDEAYKLNFGFGLVGLRNRGLGV